MPPIYPTPISDRLVKMKRLHVPFVGPTRRSDTSDMRPVWQTSLAGPADR